MQKAMFLNFFIFSHLFYENIIIVKKEYSKKKYSRNLIVIFYEFIELQEK